MAGTDEDFLSRWSRRKRAVRAGAPVEEARPVAPEGDAPTAVRGENASPPEPLPPVETLTPESDFTPFMDREVDPGVRREALKKLFSDPRYNVMDRLDTYIDDYSIPDPIPEDWLGKLAAMAGLGDVPGRQRAEREARELAEREAPDAAGAVPVAGEAAEAAPGGRDIAEINADADEGLVEVTPPRAGQAMPSIPAPKLGD